jgi:hypothetical protein
MEHERKQTIPKPSAQTQGGNVMKFNETELESVSHFPSLQVDLEGYRDQNEYSVNEVMKCVAI